LMDGGGGWDGFLSCRGRTPAAPPTLNTELAGAVVATVEKLASLPFRKRVKVLEAEEDGIEDPWYKDEVVEDGCE